MMRPILTVISISVLGCSGLTAGNLTSAEWFFADEQEKRSDLPAANLPVILKPRAGNYSGYEPRWGRTLEQNLEAGHVYSIILRARALNPSSTGSTALKFALTAEKQEDRYRPVFTCGPALSAEFETFTAPFLAEKDMPAGTLSYFLVHGFGDADVEVAEVRIADLGSGKPLSAYSRTGRWYAGQEENAPWRAKAQEMIENNRMGTFAIEVVDGQGQPVKDARVIIEQQSHAYRFGVAINSLLAPWIKPDAASNHTLINDLDLYKSESGRSGLTFAERRQEIETYFEKLILDFNYVVLENAFKWQAWCGEWGGFRQSDTLELVDWLREQGLAVKGHALVWPGWDHSPKFIKGMAKDPQGLKRLIRAHIADVGLAMNGRVVAVDVLNEAFNNNDYMELLGNEVMTEWFKAAREVLPDAQLNVNDFRIIANGGYWDEKLDFYDNLIEELIENGAPIDAIGFQNHYRHNFLTAPERVWELCDRFGRHGLQLSCSEFDVDLADEVLQAAFTRDFLTAWFAHPDTNAFLQWGFWQGSHWLRYGGLYDLDWRMKPNAKVYRNLVFDQWWSGWEETCTDINGKTALRGFLGDYRITINAEGRETILERITLKKGGTSITIRL